MSEERERLGFSKMGHVTVGNSLYFSLLLWFNYDFDLNLFFFFLS